MCSLPKLFHTFIQNILKDHFLLLTGLNSGANLWFLGCVIVHDEFWRKKRPTCHDTRGNNVKITKLYFIGKWCFCPAVMLRRSGKALKKAWNAQKDKTVSCSGKECHLVDAIRVYNEGDVVETSYWVIMLNPYKQICSLCYEDKLTLVLPCLAASWRLIRPRVCIVNVSTQFPGLQLVFFGTFLNRYVLF